MKLSGKIDFKKINFKGFFFKIFSIIEKMRVLIFFILLFASIFYSGWIFYKYVKNYKWNEAQKQEYLNTKEKEVVFEEDKFNRVVSEVEARKAKSQSNINDVNDIFRIKQ